MDGLDPHFLLASSLKLWYLVLQRSRMSSKCFLKLSWESKVIPRNFTCLLSVRFSLISAIVSSEMGLFSDRTLLDFGTALSTAVLIAVTIKSAYLPRSLVDVSPVKSVEPSATSSVDSNTSLSVWSNLYLVVNR